MRVLVIGYTALIGTAITDYLMECGDDGILYNHDTTKALIPTRPKSIRGKRKDYAGFEAQMAQLSVP